MWPLETGSHTVHHLLPASGAGLGALQAASPSLNPWEEGQDMESNEQIKE